MQKRAIPRVPSSGPRLDERRWMVLILIAAALTLAGSSHATSDGIIGRSGRQTGVDCRNCHTQVATATMTVNLAGPTLVEVGSTNDYTLTIEATALGDQSPGSAECGVGLEALSGTLVAVDADTRVEGGTELVHNLPRLGSPGPLASTVCTYSFQFEAPAEVGGVFLWAAGLLTNANGQVTGDDTRLDRLLVIATLPAAPGVPENFMASDGTNATGIELSWEAVEAATSYDVFRAEGSDALAFLTNVPGNSFLDTGVPTSTLFRYRVEARNAGGAGPPGPIDGGFAGAPPAPASLSASDGRFDDRVRVQWDTTEGVESYLVLREDSGGGLAVIGETSAPPFDDLDAPVGTVLTYFARGVNDFGNGPLSAPDTGFVSPVPIPSFDLTAFDSGDDRGCPVIDGTRLAWIHSENGASSVRTYSIGGKGPVETIGTIFFDGQCSESSLVASDDNVAWAGDDGQDLEIFVWSGEGAALQLTDNDYRDDAPDLSGDELAWEAEVGDADTEIMYWPGAGEPQQLTDNDVSERDPAVFDGLVLWIDSSGAVQLWDGQGPAMPISEGTTSGSFPDISSAGAVFSAISPIDSERHIYLWDAASLSQVSEGSTNNSRPRISGASIIWEGLAANDPEFDTDVFRSEGGSAASRLSDNDVEDQFPDISGLSGSPRSVWESAGQPVFDDGTVTVILVDDGEVGFEPRVSGDRIAWWQTGEIVLATPVPEPGETALLLAALAVLAVLAGGRTPNRWP